MTPLWSGTVAGLAALDPARLPADGWPAGHWAETVPLLRRALAPLPAARGWHAALGVRLLRLGRRLDAVLASDRAVLALLVRPGAGAFRAADRAAVEDAALDLADFHAGCAGLPVLPVLVVPNGARPGPARTLPLAGVGAVVEATRLTLPALLREVAERFPPVAAAPWTDAAYRPVPGLMEAACRLYARHDSAELADTGAEAATLARVDTLVRDAVDRARAGGDRVCVFITGAPGAGKTVCGLNAAFAPGLGAAFLTGNPTLVHVLREALARDAAARGMNPRAARRRMEGVIQHLPAFRDHYTAAADPPAERVLVVDEAQRCWTAAHAVAKTRGGPAPLSDSEPGHLLDIMARTPGWTALVLLCGGGQEIHDGEGGLAAWGEALRSRPAWRVLAPPEALDAPDARQRLPGLPGSGAVPGLHLGVPVRALRSPHSAAWVDAVLAGDAAAARAVAEAAGGVPFRVTRGLDALRAWLRASCRGARRAGLVASSGARRLRAEGLGAVLPHQDEVAVARWFLDRWPDVRSAGALEVVATEFCVQGLELDHIGLCWDADLVRPGPGAPGGAVGGASARAPAAAGTHGARDGPWVARAFRGTAWTRPRRGETVQNRLNAYRVLLTRARQDTAIWVPRGDAADPTRDPALYDAVAEFLLACGAGSLEDAPPAAEAPPPMPTLL